MGCRILHDVRAEIACMYDSVTDTAFGPVFYGQVEGTNDGERMYGPNGDAGDRCASFIRFVCDHGTDPRKLTDGLLQKLLSDWSNEIHDLQPDL